MKKCQYAKVIDSLPEEDAADLSYAVNTRNSEGSFTYSAPVIVTAYREIYPDGLGLGQTTVKDHRRKVCVCSG